MIDDRLFKQIRRYYGEQQPSPETAAFLLELARRKQSFGGRSKTVWLTLVAGVAAAIAAGVIGYRIGAVARPASDPNVVIASSEKSKQNDGDEKAAVVDGAASKSNAAAPSVKAVVRNDLEAQNKIERSTPERERMRGKPVVATIPPIEGEDLPHPSAAPSPRLLLARIYAEWCPRTPRLIPVYELLAQDYANEPIMIVTFDVTDPGKRRQSGYMAHSLGVLGLLGHKWEPSTILLIDRETCEILETIREVDEQPRMEEALTVALHR